MLGAEPLFVAGLVVAVVTFPGVMNGLAGFGFAVVGTTTLAITIDRATAVVMMIIPILAANLALVRGLSPEEWNSCGVRFAPLVLSALVGMAVLDRLPDAPLRIGLGVVSLASVMSLQNLIVVPGLSRARDGCFVETPIAMAGVGGVSGLLFGATNVGVQLVAYIRSLQLRHGLFVGVVAIVFVGINVVRVGAASVFGLYPDAAFVVFSLLAAIPAVVGVTIGVRVRNHLPDRTRHVAVFGLLTVIGVRLLFDGVGIA